MLSARGLRKQWGAVRALDGFDLSIEPGEICGLMGHNGAGKTTFARICAGLERPDDGSVWIGGVDLASAPRSVRSWIGLAPQELALYPTVTLRQNLKLFGGLAGLRGARLRQEIEEVCAAVDLTPMLDRVVAKLSGGQQRRAQAATALLHRPPVLLLDEPTVGADPTTRQMLLALVRSRAEEGAAVCYTTHYLPELEDLGATLAVASAGRVIARGSREDLLTGLPGRVVVGFTGSPPAEIAARATTVAGSGELVFSAIDPARALAALLAELGSRTDSVRSVEVQEPSLDDLYQHLADQSAGHTTEEKVHSVV